MAPICLTFAVPLLLALVAAAQKRVPDAYVRRARFSEDAGYDEERGIGSH